MRIAFVGDSISAAGKWSEVIDFAEAKTFAVPGALTDNLLEAIPTILEFKADLISILIGTNDFGNTAVNRSGIDAAKQVLKIVSEFRAKAPEAILLVHTILPRGIEESGVDLRPRVIEANKYLTEHLGSDINVLDLWSAFVAPDGLSLADEFVMSDEPVLKLHLNSNGYEKWESLLIPILQKLLKA